jgi:hypothetical protein
VSDAAGGEVTSVLPDALAESGPHSDDSPPDGPPSEAAPSDAGSEPDGDGGSWCGANPGHRFCEDFDGYQTVAGLLGSWSSFEQSGGSFKLDPSTPLSPPYALEAIGANSAKVMVLETLPVSPAATVLRLELDLRVNSSGNVGLLTGLGIVAIAFGPSIDYGYAAIGIAGGPKLTGAWAGRADGGADAGTFQSATASGTFPAPGTWAARYALEIDTSSTGGCVQVYEGPTALLSPCLALPADLLRPSVVSVVLGDYTVGLGNTGSIDVDFDNVTFDVR